MPSRRPKDETRHEVYAPLSPAGAKEQVNALREKISFLGLIASALVSAAGCGRSPAAADVPVGPMPPDAIARVSGNGVPPLVITTDQVVDIARASRSTKEEARDRAVSDALFAAEATRSNIDRAHALALDGVLARRLAADLLKEAKEEGPLRDTEVETITEKHWYDVARPEAFMTTMAVVQFPKDADADTVKRAKEVADAIHEAALKISPEAVAEKPLPEPTSSRIGEDPLTTAFKKTVGPVETKGFDVVVQQIEPIAKDGRSVLPVAFDQRTPYDPAYVAATNALAKRGQLSPVFRSEFGFHVAIVLNRYAAHELSLAERRERFGAEVYDLRAQANVKQLLARLHKETNVEIERNADALLAQVSSGDLALDVAANAKASHPAPPESPRPTP